MDSRAFYDDYVGRQTAAGVNERHHAILGWLERFGLEADHRVLEIGCGVGTLTQLLVPKLEGGELLAVDLSPKSIEAARERLGAPGNVRLMAADVLEMDVDGTFDVIVLPDVIEHIPVALHPKLFQRLAEWLAPDGFVLAHYPNPWYLEWCHEHRPELLQPVDQPIHADTLTQNAYAHGLYLACLQTYSLWIEEGDYVAAVFKLASNATTFTPVDEEAPSLLARLRHRITGLLG
ncbi:MAG TPA: class I SAM-dependent methyltransferase [Longimicrobiales bacterium]|nr:class I SAM-dependent methyltransferase [Longimicrobiales bacterium]